MTGTGQASASAEPFVCFDDGPRITVSRLSRGFLPLRSVKSIWGWQVPLVPPAEASDLGRNLGANSSTGLKSTSRTSILRHPQILKMLARADTSDNIWAVSIKFCGAGVSPAFLPESSELQAERTHHCRKISSFRQSLMSCPSYTDSVDVLR